MLDCTLMVERSVRGALPEDEDFLWRLYVSTRVEELAAFGWPPEQQQAFLRMQYRARRGSYEAAYPQAEHSILVENGAPIGAMIVDRNAREIRLVDIALLPEHRNRGYGEREVADLIREAESLAIPLRLSVLRGNPAQRLYARLGLVLKSADAMYIEMEYTSGGGKIVDGNAS
jgi:GNAT superfamily N-acetyltransferase